MQELEHLIVDYLKVIKKQSFQTTTWLWDYFVTRLCVSTELNKI